MQFKDGSVIIGSSSYQRLAAQIADIGGWTPGKVKRKLFEAGDPYLELAPAEVQHRHVVVLGGTVSVEEKDEILRLAHTAFNFGALSITMLCPYFGNQRQERVTKPGQHCPAKVDAILFSHLPKPPFGYKLMLCDLHCEQIVNYFENDVRAVAVQLKSITAEAIRHIGQDLYRDNWELMGCDQGILKWVMTLGDMVGKSPGCGLKRRKDGKAELYGLMGDVAGKNVVWFDDILFTGSTAMQVAELARKQGAREQSLVVSHALCPGDSMEKIVASELFQRIITTDTNPRALELAEKWPRFVEVRSTATLLAHSLVNPWWSEEAGSQPLP